jgi:hypothetical protein
MLFEDFRELFLLEGHRERVQEHSTQNERSQLFRIKPSKNVRQHHQVRAD